MRKQLSPIQKISPKIGDTRMIKKFAWLPTVVYQHDSKGERWLILWETYKQWQVFKQVMYSYRFNKIQDEWVNDNRLPEQGKELYA